MAYECRRSQVGIKNESRGRLGTLPAGKVGWKAGDECVDEAGVVCWEDWAEWMSLTEKTEDEGDGSACSSCWSSHFCSQTEEQ